MSSPPGYNLETMTEIGLELQEYFLPFLEHSPEQFYNGETEVPALAYLNLSIQASRIRIISQPKDPAHIKPMMDAIAKKYETYPGMRTFVTRGSIITSNSGGSRSINLDISGASLQDIYDVALSADQRAKTVFENPRVRANPSTLSLSQPMVEIKPDWNKLAETGMTASELGLTVSALTDGAFVDEFFLDDDKIDIYLYSNLGNQVKLDDLNQLPVYTPAGAVIPLSAIATINETVDTSSIRRVDGRRTVTLNIIPPESVPLEIGVEIVKQDVVSYLQQAGEIPNNVKITISGASDQLDATRESLSSNYLIAVIIIYLLLVAIFTHWGYPVLIMATIPLGISGGIFGLWLMNSIGGWLPSIGLAEISQSFDMITMLGFLILMGTVVNNPILIVHQAMTGRNQGMNAVDAVKNAVETRIKPIAMSTLTTVFVIEHLVMLPGEVTDLYRGDGVIVIFVILCSDLYTLTFLQSMTVSVLQRKK